MEREKMLWWLMLASGLNPAHGLHRGEACTEDPYYPPQNHTPILLRI